MKNKRSKKKTNAQVENSDEESTSSCQTRRRIEDLLERRRYQDELGDFDQVFDIPATERA